MNEIVNRFLLFGDKFMPEMHLRQPARGPLHAGFTYSACGPSTKNKERIQKFKETGDKSYIYKNGDFKDLKRRANSDKVLRDKAFNIAKIPKYDGYQRGVAYMVYKFFNKKSASLTNKSISGSSIVNNDDNNNNNDIKQNHQLAKELHKPIIKKN